MSTSAPVRRSSRLEHLDFLRGLGAILICLCHFELAFPSQFHAWLMKFGEVGVFSFFLISGFIMPRVMSKEKYRLAKFGTFMARRLARLHPPYLAALALTLVASLAAAAWKGQPTTWNASDLVPFFFYLDWPAENPVFWTLQVEMCFYIFIALTYGLFNSPNALFRWSAFALGIVLWLTYPQLVFFRVIAFFLVGVALEQFQRGVVGRTEFVAKMLIGCGMVWMTRGLENLPLGPISVLSCLAISAFIVRPPAIPGAPLFLWLGSISYPLYLVHFPFGVKLINLSLAKAPFLPPLLIAATAILFSVVVAWLIHRYVERPGMRWSASIGAPQREAPVMAKVQ